MHQERLDFHMELSLMKKRTCLSTLLAVKRVRSMLEQCMYGGLFSELLNIKL